MALEKYAFAAGMVLSSACSETPYPAEAEVEVVKECIDRVDNLALYRFHQEINSNLKAEKRAEEYVDEARRALMSACVVGEYADYGVERVHCLGVGTGDASKITCLLNAGY